MDKGKKLPVIPLLTALLISLVAGAPAAIVHITGLELVEGPRFPLAGDGRAGKAGHLGWGDSWSSLLGQALLVEFALRQTKTTNCSLSEMRKKTKPKENPNPKSLCPHGLGSVARSQEPDQADRVRALSQQKRRAQQGKN